MNTATWLNQVTSGLSSNQLANAIGRSPSTVTRWRSGDIPISSEDAIAVARHFGAPVRDTLIDLGFVTAEDLPMSTLRDEHVDALIGELQRRAIMARHTLGRVSAVASKLSSEEHLTPQMREHLAVLKAGLGEYATEVQGIPFI